MKLKQLTPKDIDAYHGVAAKAVPFAAGTAVALATYIFWSHYLDNFIQVIKTRKPPKTYVDEEGVERTAYHDPESDTYYSGADVAKPQQKPYEQSAADQKALRKEYDRWVKEYGETRSFDVWYYEEYVVPYGGYRGG